jgi:hypothetical protein
MHPETNMHTKNHTGHAGVIKAAAMHVSQRSPMVSSAEVDCPLALCIADYTFAHSKKHGFKVHYKLT